MPWEIGLAAAEALETSASQAVLVQVRGAPDRVSLGMNLGGLLLPDVTVARFWGLWFRWAGRLSCHLFPKLSANPQFDFINWVWTFLQKGV